MLRSNIPDAGSHRVRVLVSILKLFLFFLKKLTTTLTDL